MQPSIVGILSLSVSSEITQLQKMAKLFWVITISFGVGLFLFSFGLLQRFGVIPIKFWVIPIRFWAIPIRFGVIPTRFGVITMSF